MGIKFFWRFFNRRYSQHITRLKKNIKLRQKNTKIDTFCIDLNGIVHPKAQIIYNYGEKKSQKNIYSNLTIAQKELECFKLILNEIEKLIRIVEPRKQLLLVLDGVAPISKQKQQRSRRYKNSLDIDEKNDFDSNCISPGTRFMDKLSKYLDFYIRIMIQKNTKINIIYSSEKNISDSGKPYQLNSKLNSYNLDFAVQEQQPNYIFREDLIQEFNDEKITKGGLEGLNILSLYIIPILLVLGSVSFVSIQVITRSSEWISSKRMGVDSKVIFTHVIIEYLIVILIGILLGIFTSNIITKILVNELIEVFYQKSALIYLPIHLKVNWSIYFSIIMSAVSIIFISSIIGIKNVLKTISSNEQTFQ